MKATIISLLIGFIVSPFVSNQVSSNNLIVDEKFLDSYSTNDLNQLIELNNQRNLRSDPNPDYTFRTTVDEEETIDATNFKRDPLYDGYAFDYTNIEVGDFVYERNQIGGIGHIGIVVNTCMPSEYGNIILTIEAVGDSVQYCFLDDTRIVQKNIQILRPNASTTQINSSLYFIRSQIGKPYSFSLSRCNTDINSTSWYCSELLYAAFLHYGLNISSGSGWDGNTCILPNHIYESFNVSEVIILGRHLKMSINSKTSNVWNIKIKNLNIFATSCLYNSKMCFFDDGRNWSGLLDTVQLTILSNSFVNVNIQENFFADSIVSCYGYRNIRLITVCKNLESTYNTLYSNYFYSYLY